MRMERGAGTEPLHKHLTDCHVMDIRQTRRGCLQQCLGCEAPSEFHYYIRNTPIAYSLEESNCCCRICYPCCYEWTMEVTEHRTGHELLTVHRPCACPAGHLKCCGYQTAWVTSGEHTLGSIQEECTCFVPSFRVYDELDRHLYTIHPPTCCGGMCVNPCTEGCPCSSHGCCKFPFWIFHAHQWDTDGWDIPRAGKILKKPKTVLTEVFTSSVDFEVTFPYEATAIQKGLLIGTSIFFNSLFFEAEPIDS